MLVFYSVKCAFHAITNDFSLFHILLNHTKRELNINQCNFFNNVEGAKSTEKQLLYNIEEFLFID